MAKEGKGGKPMYQVGNGSVQVSKAINQNLGKRGNSVLKTAGKGKDLRSK